MKLYFAPGTISVAVGIALEEAGIDYELRRLSFSKGEQRGADYAKVNPKGRVPSLELDDGTILTETGALLEFIAAQDARLMPANPVHAANVRSVMYYLASTMHVNHAHRMRGARWADNAESHADMAAKVPETMAASAAFVNENCLHGPFVLGEHISVADCYLFAVCSWLPGDGVPIEDYPAIATFMEAMNSRASIAAVRAKGILP